MNAEKDADYDNTCNGEKRVQQERPHSPVLSVLSMKSDKSMKMPIQLKAEDSLFNQSHEEKSDSPVPSVLSMKSDKSMKMPIQLKDGECLFDQSALERSHSPDPSVWSLKSDKSMKMPIQLKDGDSVSDQSRINMLEAHESGSPVTMLSLHKCAVKKAFGSRNGHLDLFLRFLMGLSLKSNHSLLEGLLVTKTDSSLEREKTIEYLKQELKEQLCPNDCVLLFHCLNELNDHSLTDESQSCEKQNMSPALWRALVYKLMTSDQRSEEFELQKYGRSDDILEWLHTVIKLFPKARLNDCNLTYKGCALLTTVLTSLSNVRELDLSNNNLQDSGVEILSVGVNRSPSGAEFLRKREMERKMHSHSQHKHGNEESQLHFHHRTAGLQDKDCSLKSLKIKDMERKMHNKGLASTCGSHNQHKHGNEEIHFHLHHRTAGLQDTECSLKSLKLEKCGMTERSCTALASALSSKTCSLTDLDLSINDLQDSGMKKLCAGLQNPHCTLEKLRLSNCNVTHEGVTALTEALKSNPSHLKELDLAKNDLEESDLKVLSIILDTS